MGGSAFLDHSSPEHEEQLAERRLKLDYSGLSTCGEASLQVWEGNIFFQKIF